ncbi:addiction module toxin RelE [Klebsiella quasipneumoniae]|uniref:Addiction module toxin RelE n=1 Tax=Klebsiella quasipneumoniae TaxID=1463165 RepID=A0AAI8NNA1_9ENTR|nr:addiction module toxin RelE [Klebsiella quasipneumoniae]AWL65197.1 addiction module toxin RelE [Klebsiella quasipneumoniae]AWL73353.1 addiction module toxin RelE [Klebsiella quasipneumoniae]
MMSIIVMRYTKSFGLHRGGKSVNPQELTPVSGWGKQT